MKRAMQALLFIFAALPHTIEAKVYLKIGTPNVQLLAVAIPNLSANSEATNISARITETIINDLEVSGILKILDRSTFPTELLNQELSPEMIDFKKWFSIGAEAIIKGKVSASDNNITIDARFYEVQAGKEAMAVMHTTDKKDMRKIGHMVADDIVENLTGEKGIFTTKTAFVSDITGNKEIYLMDYDGEGIEAITKNGSINLSPAWSPDGFALSFVSYKDGRPAVYIRELAGGNDTRLKVLDGTIIGASWSPDGDRLAIVVSRDGNADVYSISRDGSSLTRLTDNWGLDVSPSWSPDGKEIAFVSDRGGSPQLYLMDSSGGNVRRLTFEGNYNASPSWSPKGDRIAFAGANNGRFDIFTIRPDGSGLIMQLTANAGNNENPTWSPDGKFITFSSTRDGGSNIYIMHSDGSGQKRVLFVKGKATTPAWGPRSKKY